MGDEISGVKEFLLSKIDHVKELLLAEITHIRELTDSRLYSLEKATSLVAEHMKQKFADTNEWRDQSKDQTATYVTKDIYDSLEKRTTNLELTRAETKGMATQSALNRVLLFSIVSAMLGITGIIMSLIMLFRG